MTRDQERQPFTLRQRFSLWLISSLGTLALRLIGPTIRFEQIVEDGGADLTGRGPHPVPLIYCFWHQCIFAATYYFRDQDIAVMTSQSYDGEYIARMIGNMGFRAVRGSSTRGGVRALLGLHTEIEQGRTAAFTIDGPRGPARVAKPGPVLLARNTGVPIVCFHIALESAWRFRTWDRMMVPKPFTRAVVCLSRPIYVPADADSASHSRFQAEMQVALDRICAAAETRATRRVDTPPSSG